MSATTTAAPEPLDELHVVFVCKRDELFIRSFTRRWKAVHAAPGRRLVFANDNKMPAKIPAGYDSVDSTWPPRPEPIAPHACRTLCRALDEHPAEMVFKMDVDCLHLSRHWLDNRPPGLQMVGIWSLYRDDATYGACYGVEAGALRDMLYEAERDMPPVRHEDLGMSILAQRMDLWRYYFPPYDEHQNIITPLRGRGRLREDFDNQPRPELIHTGEFGHCARARRKALAYWELCELHYLVEHPEGPGNRPETYREPGQV